jgi:hypothetical protein
MLDTDVDMLRKQAELMQRLSPDERVRWVLAWSSALLRESLRTWSADRGGAGQPPGVAPEGAALEAWLRAQHGGAIAPGFGAAHLAWRRRQGVPAELGG